MKTGKYIDKIKKGLNKLKSRKKDEVGEGIKREKSVERKKQGQHL